MSPAGWSISASSTRWPRCWSRPGWSGYDQARLDDRQFACYRLGGFGDAEVGEYARKWFRSGRRRASRMTPSIPGRERQRPRSEVQPRCCCR